MHWLKLPEPHQNIELAFRDLASARIWLAEQPQAQAQHMLPTICRQIDAIDGAGLPAQLAIDLLNLLRSAAVPSQAAVESRYFRKALPMPEDDVRTFETAQQLWLSLGIAYLRLAPHFPPTEKLLPLNRAACAIRMAEYCHFQAARECPPLLDQLLFGILAQAESSRVLRLPLADPDFPHLGEANIAGHLAWAFLLRLIDPYRLSAAQLTVANRAISRWRELAPFQSMPDDDPRAHSVDLQPLFGAPLPEGLPRWLEVRKVERKIEQRIAALQDGESPESLKLGRELSGAACIRLLREIESSLESSQPRRSSEAGDIELAFGLDNAYAILTGEFLRSAALDTGSAALAHQRIAMFGFDRLSSMPTAVKKLNVPSEQWSLSNGWARRQASGERRLSPSLVTAQPGDTPRVGVLLGLLTDATGSLYARLNWYDGHLEGVRLPGDVQRRQAELPGLLLDDGERLSLIAPVNANLRLDTPLTVQGKAAYALRLQEVVERGADFVRYAITLT